MKSPFQFFRDNKVLMSIIFGLAIIAFVLLTAVTDPADIPPSLIFLTVIAICGGAAVIIGMPTKRSSEYGIWGVVFGVAIAILITRTGGPAQAMVAKGGDVSIEQLMSLRNQRQIANEFVARVMQQTQSVDPRDMFAQQELMQKQRQFMLGFGLPEDRDVLTTELLYREADAMGLEANEKTVTEYLTQISDGKLSQEKLKEICGELKISVSQIYEFLQRELQARMAAELLYDYAFDEIYRISPTLPPEQYWDFYRKLYVRQKVTAAALPVEDFINEDVEPPESELQELFAAHAANFPQRTEEGLPAPGDPGFRQPRRVRIAFLESVFLDVKETIEPVTEEEIRVRYDKDHVQPAEAAAEREQEQAAAEAEAAAEESTEEPASPDSETSTDNDESTEPESDDEPGSKPDDPPSEESSDPVPETEASTDDTPEEESTTTPPVDESSAEPPAETSNEADADADSAEPTSTPADASDSEPTEPTETDETDETDGSEPAEEPTEDNPEAEPAAGETETTAEEPGPAVPASNVPLLDTVLKEEIRIKLENERTREKMQEQMANAAYWLESDVGEPIFAPEGSEDLITDEQAAELVRDYAQQHNLHYVESELLSYTELSESEDYPVGKAMTVVPLGAQAQAIPNAVFEAPQADRYRPITAEEPVFSSWFVVWKLEDKADYIPESMTDERVREQVVQAWREQQARPIAEDRAEKLASLARDTDAPLAEALGEATITGEKDTLMLQLTETGEFTWLTTGSLQPQLYSRTPPMAMSPAGIDKGGEDFMKVVFDELTEGEVGVAANADRSIYYVVTVRDRIPAAGEDFDTFRQNFLAQQVFEKNDLFAGMGFDSVYRQLAVMKTQESRSDFWVDDLWNRQAAELLVGN